MQGQHTNHKHLARVKNYRKKRYVDKALMLQQQRCGKHSIFVMQGQHTNHKHLAHVKSYRKKRYMDQALMLSQQRCGKHSIVVMQGQHTNHKHLAHMKNYTLGIKSPTLASHLLRLHGCVGLGALPDGKAECDLVDKVGQVVDQIQGCIVRVIEDQIAEEVACWVDCPANGDNKVHNGVRAL